MYTNLDGYNNKRNELLTRIAEKKPDVIGLTEIMEKRASWKLMQEDLILQGYSAYLNLTGRGAALYIRNDIQADEMSSTVNDIPAVWCCISLKNQDKLLIGVVYRSPTSTETDNNDMLTMISEMVNKKTSHILIMGDFNFPGIDWHLLTSNGPATEQLFLESFRNWFLWQHVDHSTRYRAQQTANILDLVMSNEESMVHDMEYNEPVGKSDHLVLNWNYNCYKDHINTETVKILYGKGNYSAMRAELGSVNWDAILASKSVDEQWSIIRDKIQSVTDTHVPHRKEFNSTSRRRKPLWMNTKVLSRIKKKKTAFEKYKQTKEGKEYIEYTRARNAAKSEIRRAVRDYEKEIAKKAKANPKAFYSLVNSKLKTRTTIGTLNDNGKEINTENGKAETFNQFFSSVFTQEDLTQIPHPEAVELKNQLLDVAISREEVLELLKKVRTDKSPGLDGIHPRILKECAEQLDGPLTILFRNTLQEVHIPQDWREASVTPIYKKGSKSQASNYRPISLTSIICKLMEKLIRNALLRHLIDNELLSSYQHGFVQGRSCMTQLLQVLDKWSEILDEGGSVDVIYLDLAKAFDTVPHQRLLRKLSNYGVGGNVLEWIRQFLTGRKQKVRIGQADSTWSAVTSGVPQGSVLGPALFVCFINDLPDVVKSFIFMYADDTKLFRQVENIEDQRELQRDLNETVKWADKWQLGFNIDKCKTMHIGRSVEDEFLYTMSHPIEKSSNVLMITKEEKDLGVWITSNLKASRHISAAANKANQILGLIRRSFTHMDIPLMKQLFTSLVRPHLEFGNVVWQPHFKKDSELLEQVQHRATRMVPGLSKLSYEDRLKKMDLPSLTYRRLRGDAIETYKYLHDIYKVDCSSMLPLHKSDSLKTRGHSLKLLKRECNSQLRGNFFGFRNVNHWNSLPDTVVTAPSVNCFKNRYDKHCNELRFTD